LTSSIGDQAIAIGDRLRFTPDLPGAPAYFVLFVVWFWLTAIARSPIADHPIVDLFFSRLRSD